MLGCGRVAVVHGGAIVGPSNGVTQPHRGLEQRGWEETNETLLRVQQDWCLVRIFLVYFLVFLVS